ncbi:hypothetical protein [Streptomyces sp. NBC_00663]|uniref:hypothetical protein n=1 Tax=Streptomyces sp. NBC_00663 TaxID=2975801 RepID=UPI003FCCAC10
MAERGPRASAATPAEAGGLVVVTNPLHAYRACPVEPLRGKTLVGRNAATSAPMAARGLWTLSEEPTGVTWPTRVYLG